MKATVLIAMAAMMPSRTGPRFRRVCIKAFTSTSSAGKGRWVRRAEWVETGENYVNCRQNLPSGARFRTTRSGSGSTDEKDRQRRALSLVDLLALAGRRAALGLTGAIFLHPGGT